MARIAVKQRFLPQFTFFQYLNHFNSSNNKCFDEHPTLFMELSTMTWNSIKITNFHNRSKAGGEKMFDTLESKFGFDVFTKVIEIISRIQKFLKSISMTARWQRRHNSRREKNWIYIKKIPRVNFHKTAQHHNTYNKFSFVWHSLKWQKKIRFGRNQYCRKHIQRQHSIQSVRNHLSRFANET